MKLVNRAAIVVTPNSSFLEWAVSTDPDAREQLGLLRNRVGVFLVEDCESPQEEQRTLKQHETSIFESELTAWYRDPAAWPKRRNYEVLNDWFTVRIESVVVDLARSEILVEEF